MLWWKGNTSTTAAVSRPSNGLQVLHGLQNFLRVAGRLDTAPFAHELAFRVDQKRAALDAANFLAVHVFHFDDVELDAELLVRIGDQFEGESHFFLEALVRLQAVSRYAGDHGT